jgi:hypothetical protein
MATIGDAMAETIRLDSFGPGVLPAAWARGVTGSGGSRWTIGPDGDAIEVSLNGKGCIDVQDTRISGAGAVGVWTNADSVTIFDDFAFDAIARP